MGHDDDPAVPRDQLAGEELDGGVVEVVGGLVQEQQVGALREPAREAHPVPLPHGQGVEAPVGVAHRAQPGEGDVDPPVRVPGGQVLGAGQQPGQPAEVAALVVEARGLLLDLGRERAQVGERAPHEVAHRLPRRRRELLLHEGDGPLAADLPAARPQVPGEQVQQRRLAGAVLPHHAQARAVGHAQAHAVEHRTAGVGEREVRDGELH